MRRERAFLLSSLFHHDLDLERLRAQAAVPLDWRWMAAAARPAAAVPFLWNAVAATGLEGTLPEALRTALRAEAEANAMQTALFLATLARITAALRGAGVEALALKGSALALLDPAYRPLRHLSDLDLLIRPGQQDAAGAVLKAAGAQVLLEERDLDGRLLTGDDLRGFETTSPASYRLDGVMLELHQDVAGAPGDPLIPVEPLFSRARTVAWRGVEILVPDLADQAGILCHHVLRHHRDEPRLTPRHVADLEALAGLGADLAEAARRFDRPGAAPVAESLALVASARRAASRPSRFLLTRVERGLSQGWQRLASRKLGLVSKLRLVRGQGLRFLFPPRRYLEARLGERSRGVPLPLLHLRRLGRALTRILRAR